MLLLRDLIRDLDIQLVAGEAGLDRPVRWVHISELADPTPWLSGGELLLTTGMNLAEPEAQRAFVERLAGHDLAGLGLGVGFAHARAPDALREAAAELDFPLFEVPYDVPFIALTEKAFSHLVNEQYAVLQRALSAHERLERIVLSEQGLEGVTDALASLIGGTALVYDARGASWRAATAACRCRPRCSRRPARRCASAPAPARGAATRRRASCTGARSRCRSCARPRAATATGRRRRRGSSRPRTAARCRSSTASCCTRRSRSWRSSCCAGASPTTPSGGSRATCSPRWSRASWPARSWRGGWSRSGCASASACSC